VAGESRAATGVAGRGHDHPGGTATALARPEDRRGPRSSSLPSHAVLTTARWSACARPHVDEVIVTNSIRFRPGQAGTAGDGAQRRPRCWPEAIVRVHENRSVSELFRYRRR